MVPLGGADAVTVHAALGAIAAADPEPNASGRALAAAFAPPGWTTTWRAAFSSARRWSGAGFVGEGDWIMGAPNILLEAAAGEHDDDGRFQAADLVDVQSRKGRRVLWWPDRRSADGRPPVGEPAALVAIEERVRPTPARPSTTSPPRT